MPALATAPGVMDLTERVQDPAFNWDDFAEGARQPPHRRRPGLRDPRADRQPGDRLQQGPVCAGRGSTRRRPTGPGTTSGGGEGADRPSKQQFGFAFPIDASEDTVWHYDAMLWEGGGDILNADNTQAAFNSAAGVQALTTLQQMAVHRSLRVPRPAERRQDRPAVQRRQDRDARHWARGRCQPTRT